jgi:hypothetical protein
MIVESMHASFIAKVSHILFVRESGFFYQLLEEANTEIFSSMKRSWNMLNIMWR